jgi:hypothetical protein
MALDAVLSWFLGLAGAGMTLTAIRKRRPVLAKVRKRRTMPR